MPSARPSPQSKSGRPGSRAAPALASRPGPVSAPAADSEIAAILTRWFGQAARDLPWRSTGSGKRDPYRSLVSEFMLQQTQVSRVLEKFEPFMTRFPTARALAEAPEKDVLAAWSGLGYYRRARLLHGAAKAIVADFGGVVPQAVTDLRQLPGVGRYTAGAISSIVFGKAEPLVDGNVARVLMRVSAKRGTAAERSDWAWERAGELVGVARRPGVFNEALMELGATVCTPALPRCDRCPLREGCEAFQRGLQGEIPSPKVAAKRKALYCASVLVEDGKGRLLVERRPATGMWASMFQAPTLEHHEPISRDQVERWLGTSGLRLLEEFDHGTTHRDVKFSVWSAGRKRLQRHLDADARQSRVFITRGEAAGLGLSNPQKRILLQTRT